MSVVAFSITSVFVRLYQSNKSVNRVPAEDVVGGVVDSESGFSSSTLSVLSVQDM